MHTFETVSFWNLCLRRNACNNKCNGKTISGSITVVIAMAPARGFFNKTRHLRRSGGVGAKSENISSVTRSEKGQNSAEFWWKGCGAFLSRKSRVMRGRIPEPGLSDRRICWKCHERPHKGYIRQPRWVGRGISAVVRFGLPFRAQSQSFSYVRTGEGLNPRKFQVLRGAKRYTTEQ